MDAKLIVGAGTVHDYVTCPGADDRLACWHLTGADLVDLGRRVLALFEGDADLAWPARQLLEGVQDQHVGIPVAYTFQIKPFIGAIQPYLLRKAADFFGEPSGDFASGQLTLFEGIGMAQQLLGEGCRKPRIASLDDIGAGHLRRGQLTIAPFEGCMELVGLGQLRQVLECLVEFEARQGVFQLCG
ncbi:hypothetical protein D3C79_781680 [compost metagenome]